MPSGYKGFQKGNKTKSQFKNGHPFIGDRSKLWKKGNKINLGKKNNKGKHWKVSETGRINNSLSHIGLKHSEKTKRKMSESQRGDKHYNWQGGKSFELYPMDWTEYLKESIRKRDDYVCQMEGCGIHQDELDGFQKKLDVHHIDYDKNNLNPENLISLCHSCHTKTNYNRNYWINYFICLIKKR